jgi:TRAP-type mannitol/chloroaromatic compound transport system permease small subunit
MSARDGRTTAALLRFCRLVDALSEKFSWLAAAAVLAACLISAGNAVVRYGWDFSSNAWLEIQWYLFAVTVMLGAPHVLRRNEHVRVDIFYARLPARWTLIVDIAGLLLFLLPFTVLLAALSWPVFARAVASGEVSSNAGGLIRWPALLLLPLGFGLVSLQGVAEIIKRVVHLRACAADGFTGGDAGAANNATPAATGSLLTTPYEKPLQ